MLTEWCNESTGSVDAIRVEIRETQVTNLSDARDDRLEEAPEWLMDR